MRKYANWLPAIFVMIIIYYFSSLSGTRLEAMGLRREIFHFNGHFFLFMALCISYFKATKNIFISIMLTVIYGMLDEFHQVFVPFRSSSLYDLSVDSMGAFVAAGGLWIILPVLPKKLKKLLLD